MTSLNDVIYEAFPEAEIIIGARDVVDDHQ